MYCRNAQCTVTDSLPFCLIRVLRSDIWWNCAKNSTFSVMLRCQSGEKGLRWQYSLISDRCGWWLSQDFSYLYSNTGMEKSNFANFVKRADTTQVLLSRLKVCLYVHLFSDKCMYGPLCHKTYKSVNLSKGDHLLSISPCPDNHVIW